MQSAEANMLDQKLATPVSSSEAVKNPELIPNKADSLANTEPAVCFHCLEPVPQYCNLSAELDGRTEPMCCIGCKAAAEFISQRGLMRFYQHRERLHKRDFYAEVANDLLSSESTVDPRSQWQFLDSQTTASAYITKGADNRRSITVLVEGLYCSSCTWLIERALHSISTNIEFQADVDARTVHISVLDPMLQMSSVVSTIARLGYSPIVSKIGDVSAAAKLAKQQRNLAIQRIVVAGFGMMQVMTYATASYFGGSVDSAVVNVTEVMDPQLERFFLLVSMLVATVVVFYSGKPFFDNALSDIRNGHLGMDVPVSLAILGAYFPSVYQVLSHSNSHVYFDSAVMFVFFLSVGRYIEMSARHKLSGTGWDVQNLLPKEISVKRHQGEQMLPMSIKPTEVVAGDQMQLKQGTTVPFDARINSGTGQLDESLLTGEALGIKRTSGDVILAGTKLLSGSLMIESTGSWSDSSIAKVQQSIQAAERSGEREQARSQMFSRYFIQIVLLLTAVVAAVWLVIEPQRVFEVCLAMLIASCPCAFALAAPIGRSAAIHYLKRVGVLLTSNAALDSLLTVDRWCFDKTGTLTRGRPSIDKVIPLSILSEDQCLQIVACIEQSSGHVLSTAFENIQTDLSAENFDESVGQGVSATVDGVLYRVGKRSWIREHLTDVPDSLDEQVKSNKAEIVLANDDEVLAIIQLHDELRSSASPFLSKFSSCASNDGVANAHVTILSGDHQASVKALCDELGISDYKAGLLPSDKLDLIKHYQSQGEVIAMVGDGINDAPVLAAADVSIAMASGSELALNNADVILLNGNLANLNSLTKIAKRASRVTKQNLTWALGYNAVALPLAALGLLTPWIAALGMSVSSVLVVLNALRIQNPAKADAPLYDTVGDAL